MDYTTLWNEICYHVNKNRGSTERDFQTTVEFLFEKIGWSQYKGEIVTQLTIPVGSAGSVRPDIVIKDNDTIVLVVELKRADSDLSERNAEQLISYMRLLRLNYGVLLGEKLQVYSEMQHSNNSPVKICDVSFNADSDIGVECIEVLSKNNYSHDRLDEFSKKCLANPDKYNELRKPENTYDLINNKNTKPRQVYVKGGKGSFPTNITIEGFEDKYRPKRLLPEIPDGFTRTNEIRDIVFWNGFPTRDYIWKQEGSDERFVIKGARKFELFIIVGEYEDGKLKADRYYYYGHTSSNYIK